MFTCIIGRKYSKTVLSPAKYWKQSFVGQKQPSEMFYKKSALKNLPKYTGKHLCRSLNFHKIEGLLLYSLPIACSNNTLIS